MRRAKADGSAHIHVRDSRGASATGRISRSQLLALRKILSECFHGIARTPAPPREVFYVELTPTQQRHAKELESLVRSLLMHYEIDQRARKRK